MIVTVDHDILERSFRDILGQFAVNPFRLGVQTVASVNSIFGWHFTDPATAAIPLERSVVVIDEVRVRISSEP